VLLGQRFLCFCIKNAVRLGTSQDIMLKPGEGNLCFVVHRTRDLSGIKAEVLKARLDSDEERALRRDLIYGVQMADLQREVQIEAR